MTKLRKRNAAKVGDRENASDAENASVGEARDPTFSSKPVTGGKKYEKSRRQKLAQKVASLLTAA